MNIIGKNVLVTGGAGFIGSSLAKRLSDLGGNVYVADNLSRGNKKNLNPFMSETHFHQADLTKLENCLQATQGMDYVFHLAASVGGIHYLLKENVYGLTPSLLMNTNMLEAARINDVDRFIFASSACVYREKKSALNRFKEEDANPACPLTTYGWAKIMGEIQCKAYHQDYGIKSSVVRIFNAYGEHENLDPRWSHVIPSLIRKAVLHPKEQFTVFGDGQQERAFLYVKDCVEGLILSMERATDADPINLGGEEIVSVGELAKRIISISGKPIQIEYDLSGPKGTNRYCADTTKMKRVLRWSAKTSLKEGLERTYQWVRRELNVEE